MKKFFHAISFLAIIWLIQSCDKHVNRLSKQIVIDTTLSAGTEYILDLKPYGDQDDVANITKQATSFATSEIINTSGKFAPVYHYTSSAKANLSDQTVLSITEGTNGNGNRRHNSDSTTITVNFTIK